MSNKWTKKCLNCWELIPDRKKYCDMNCRTEFNTVSVTCTVCGKEDTVWKSRAKNYKTCSVECRDEYLRAPSNVICYICGKEFHVKESYLKGLKNSKKITCSIGCNSVRQATDNLGENNPNFGNVGLKNPMTKIERITNSGYRLVHAIDHPFAIDRFWIREHRLVAEHELMNDSQTVVINGIKYLSPEYDVHHKNEDKLDNHPDNLMILTRADHMKLHHNDTKEDE